MLKIKISGEEVHVKFFQGRDLQDRTVTTAKVVDNNYVYFAGTTCSLKDKFNANLGRRIAFTRLLQKLTSDKSERLLAQFEYAKVFSRKNKIMREKIKEQIREQIFRTLSE